jgi:hypothetical protein
MADPTITSIDRANVAPLSAGLERSHLFSATRGWLASTGSRTPRLVLGEKRSWILVPRDLSLIEALGLCRRVLRLALRRSA